MEVQKKIENVLTMASLGTGMLINYHIRRKVHESEDNDLEGCQVVFGSTLSVKGTTLVWRKA